MKKRLLSIIMALALCLSLLPTAAFAAGSVSYVDENGNTQTYTGEYTVVTAGTRVTWGAAGTTTWYVVNSNATIAADGYAVVVYGDVRLILMDGCTLTTGRIDVWAADLTIYAQSTGENMGRLEATGRGNYAAIDTGSSNVTINGGYIKATGGSPSGSNSAGGAGIGGGGGWINSSTDYRNSGGGRLHHHQRRLH